MARVKQREGNTSQQIKGRESSSYVTDGFPSFCFEHLQNQYGFSELQKEDKIAFANFLAGIAKCRWSLIMTMPRRGSGYERIYDSSFNVHIPKNLRGKKFIAFRGAGIMRIIGFRERNTLHIVWLDTRGKVYYHG